MKFLLGTVFLGFLFGFQQSQAEQCKFVPEGCHHNTKCYWGRLKMSCDDGKIGFVNDREVPETFRVYVPYGNGIKGGKTLDIPNSKQFKLIDIVRQTDAYKAWAQSVGIKESYEQLDLDMPKSAGFYQNVSGDLKIPTLDSNTQKYSCQWKSSPTVIQAKCPGSKPVCLGKAVCTDNSTQAIFQGEVSCFEATAGKGCVDVSKCASVDEDVKASRCGISNPSVSAPGDDDAVKSLLNKINNTRSTQ